MAFVPIQGRGWQRGHRQVEEQNRKLHTVEPYNIISSIAQEESMRADHVTEGFSNSVKIGKIKLEDEYQSAAPILSVMRKDEAFNRFLKNGLHNFIQSMKKEKEHVKNIQERTVQFQRWWPAVAGVDPSTLSAQLNGKTRLRDIRTVPAVGAFGTKLLNQLVSENVPLLRASWFIKTVYLNLREFQPTKASLQKHVDSKARERTRKWTSIILQYIQSLSHTSNDFHARITYCIRLLVWQYNEGIIDVTPVHDWIIQCISSELNPLCSYALEFAIMLFDNISHLSSFIHKILDQCKPMMKNDTPIGKLATHFYSLNHACAEQTVNALHTVLGNSIDRTACVDGLYKWKSGDFNLNELIDVLNGNLDEFDAPFLVHSFQQLVFLVLDWFVYTGHNGVDVVVSTLYKSNKTLPKLQDFVERWISDQCCVDPPTIPVVKMLSDLFSISQFSATMFMDAIVGKGMIMGTDWQSKWYQSLVAMIPLHTTVLEAKRMTVLHPDPKTRRKKQQQNTTVFNKVIKAIESNELNDELITLLQTLLPSEAHSLAAGLSKNGYTKGKVLFRVLDVLHVSSSSHSHSHSHITFVPLPNESLKNIQEKVKNGENVDLSELCKCSDTGPGLLSMLITIAAETTNFGCFAEFVMSVIDEEILPFCTFLDFLDTVANQQLLLILINTILLPSSFLCQTIGTCKQCFHQYMSVLSHVDSMEVQEKLLLQSYCKCGFLTFHAYIQTSTEILMKITDLYGLYDGVSHSFNTMIESGLKNLLSSMCLNVVGPAMGKGVDSSSVEVEGVLQPPTASQLPQISSPWLRFEDRFELDSIENTVTSLPPKRRILASKKRRLYYL